jgi:hypothetical protein
MFAAQAKYAIGSRLRSTARELGNAPSWRKQPDQAGCPEDDCCRLQDRDARQPHNQRVELARDAILQKRDLAFDYQVDLFLGGDLVDDLVLKAR